MGDIDLIKKRMRETFCLYDEKEIPKIVTLFQEDGSFSDVNYSDNSSANWLPEMHMARCKTLACAYPNNHELGIYIVKAMEYWFYHNYQCPNWWYNELGIPQSIRIILLNCSDILEQDIRNKMINSLQKSIEAKWTGMNKIWFAENVIFRGVLSGDEELLKKGRDYVAETIFVSEERQEGAQVDGSFAQHRMQLYNHGYGKGFILNAATWFDIFYDTSFAFGGDTVKVITDLYLNGTAKMGRYNSMDFSAMGRNIVRCYNPDDSARTMKDYKKAAEILARCNRDAETSDKLRKTINFIDGLRNNPYEECNTSHWILKFMTHHRNGFYSSVRMASKEVLGAECLNGENCLGGFGAYGLCIYMRDGKEYTDIFPVLDWGCLPGTTTPHVEIHPGVGGCHESEFVGSVSDGMYGVAAADMYKTYTYDGENASFGGKQAYFFLDECVLHLGTDLYSTSEKEFHTTLDQCWLKTDVYMDGKKYNNIDKYADNKETDNTCCWQEFACRYVYHDHKAYINIDQVPLKLKAGENVGSYKRIYMSETAPQQEVKGNTFTLIMPHAKENASYQYAVMPNTDMHGAERFMETLPFEILVNNGKVQAVWYKEALYAVFYESGNLNLQPENFTHSECSMRRPYIISVDKPCMLIWHSQKQKLYVSTPDKSVGEISVTISEKEYLVKMPEDRRFRGSSVEFSTEPVKTVFDAPIIHIAYSELQGIACPANTEELYRTAAKLGFQALKGDVRPTCDGGLVLCHDVGFTLDHQGRITKFDKDNCVLISGMSTAEVLALEYDAYHKELGYYAHPCTFETFAAVCKEYGLICYPTIRDENMENVVPALLEILHRYDMRSHTMINSMTLDSLYVVRKYDKAIRLCYTLRSKKLITREHVDQVIALGNAVLDGFNFPYEDAFEKLETAAEAIEYAKMMGVRLY